METTSKRHPISDDGQPPADEDTLQRIYEVLVCMDSAIHRLVDELVGEPEDDTDLAAAG